MKLGKVEASLDRIDRRESVALAQMQERYDSKARKMRGVIADLGLKLDANQPASGGPFVPVKLPLESLSFERALTQVNISVPYADKLSAELVAVPLRVPVTGEIDFTSPFGVHSIDNPFLRVPAMHTGIDFRGNMGEPIHATAAGAVTTAGWTGGYGNMVEIDHGEGACDPIRAPLGNRRHRRAKNPHRPGHRPSRLDRALDRPTFAL